MRLIAALSIPLSLVCGVGFFVTGDNYAGAWVGIAICWQINFLLGCA